MADDDDSMMFPMRRKWDDCEFHSTMMDSGFNNLTRLQILYLIFVKYVIEEELMKFWVVFLVRYSNQILFLIDDHWNGKLVFRHYIWTRWLVHAALLIFHTNLLLMWICFCFQKNDSKSFHQHSRLQSHKGLNHTLNITCLSVTSYLRSHTSTHKYFSKALSGSLGSISDISGRSTGNFSTLKPAFFSFATTSSKTILFPAWERCNPSLTIPVAENHHIKV